MFGFFNRNTRRDANATFSDENLKEVVFAAREQLQKGGSKSLSVPEAMTALRRFMTVVDAIDAADAYDCEYHGCTFTVYLDHERTMWYIQTSRKFEALSPYDPSSGFRLLAWVDEFRNTVVDQRNLCAVGYVSWDPDKQLEPGERYR